MRYLRCQCGKAEYWDGGVPPQPCQGCSDCGTTYAGCAADHQPLEEHDWAPRYNQATGEQDRRRCRRCHRGERISQ